MTVKELIEELQYVTNEDSEIIVKDQYGNICDILDYEELDDTFVIYLD